MLDTATQRPATGMDGDARQLILNTLEGSSERAVVAGLLRDSYAGLTDYLTAVRQVWGDEAADDVGYAVVVAQNRQSTIPSFGEPHRANEAIANALLLHMPEPDFRSSVFRAVQELRLAASPVERITSICRKRGIPWEFTANEGFRWIGDAEVEASALRPALSAIEDPRLLGARNHFEAARSELALGTPTSLRQSVHESACAVEGTMKVLLAQRGVPYDEKDAAFKLFDRLVNAEVVPRFMEYCVLAAASPRNKRGGHGAGEAPHGVPQEIAEGVIAAAAVAITYLFKLLP